MDNFVDFLKEFFRITSNIKGDYMGPQHLIVASIVTILIIFLGIFLGLRNKNKEEKQKKKVLLIFGIIMWSFHIAHMIGVCARSGAYTYFKYESPFFLCDIQLFAIPLAYFAKGKFKDALLGFCICLGILTAFMGVWFNAGVFSGEPIWSSVAIWAIVTHSIPGIIALYIPISGLYKLKLKEVWMSLLVMLPFELAAVSIDYISYFQDGKNIESACNYMFFLSSSGTPFSIFEGWAHGNLPLYSFFVFLGMNAFVCLYYLIWELVTQIIRKIRTPKVKVA